MPVSTLRNIRDLASKSTPSSAAAASPGDAAEDGRNHDAADDIAPPLPPELPVVPRSQADRLFDDMASAGRLLNKDVQMVDGPMAIEGSVAMGTPLGVVLRNDAGLYYVPRQYFEDVSALRPGASVVQVNVAANDTGSLTASVVDRIEKHAKPREVAEPVSAEALRSRMEKFDPALLQSNDPAQRAAAKQELRAINEAMGSVNRADIETAARNFGQRLAAAVRTNQNSPESPTNPTQQHLASGGGGGGFNLQGKNLLLGGLAGWGVLSAGGGLGLAAIAGGTLAMGGGSAALNAFKQARERLGEEIDRRRLSSTDVLAKQVNSIAADIERETAWLRGHGLESIERAMKAQGATLGEVARNMDRGGPLEHLGLQFKGLMADPAFAARYAALDSHLDRFGAKAERYVKAAQAAQQDPDPLIDALAERVAKAVDGVPSEKDGRFGLVSEKISEIVDRIKAVVQQLVGRLVPGRG